jgi:hypothetical protein
MKKKYIYGILAAIVFFNIVFTVPILKAGYPSGGDIVGHYDLVVNTVETIKHLFSTGDLVLWNEDYYFGFPLFFYYAPLPYILIALMSLVTGTDSLLLLKLAMILVFSFFPIIMYKALRLLEIDEKFCLCISFFSTSMSSITVFGLEYYAFFATGLFSQLVALLFFPFAFAYSYRYLVLGKGKAFWPVLFLSLTFITHFFVGLIAAATVGLLFVSCLIVRWKEQKEILKKFALLLLFFSFTISFLVVPYLLNQKYFGNITIDLEKKNSGYGFGESLRHLLGGDLLDYSGHNRWPILTLLFIVGLFVVFIGKEFSQYKILRWFLFFALLFSFICVSGEKTFGFFAWLPILSSVQTFRFIFLFHFVALFFIGASLYWIIDLIGKKKVLFVLVLLLVISVPIFTERSKTMEEYSYSYDLTQDVGYWEAITAMQETNLDGRVHVPFSSGIVEMPQHLQAIPLLTGNGILVSTGIGGHDSLMSFYSSFPLENALLEMYGVSYVFTFEENKYKIYVADDRGFFSLVDVPFSIDATAVAARDTLVTWLYSDASNTHFVSIGGEAEIHISEITNDIAFMSVTETHSDFDNKIYGQLLYEDHSPIAVVDDSEISVYDLFQEYSLTHDAVNCGNVETLERRRGYYRVHVDVLEECSLLFKMSYHPEWRVIVDGIEKEIEQLSPAFMGVALNEGEHNVVFEYKVFWYRWALLIVGLFSLVVLWFVGKKDLM